MASPPVTPTFSRRQSAQSVDWMNGTSPRSPRRTSSLHSRGSSTQYSPSQSRLGSSHGMAGTGSLAQELGGFGDSLADELGGWDEDEEMEENDEESDAEGNGYVEQERDSGIDVTSSPADLNGKQAGRLLTVTTQGKGHRRKGSDYDGSEYGSESDFEESQLVSASLEARLAAIESLARRGSGDVTGQESVVARATEQLKDLGGQAGMETGVTRLTTAHTAISTHLAHQSRVVQKLTSALFSPLAPPPTEEMINSILPALSATVSLIPTITPSPQPATELHGLTNSTTDLIDSLSTLSDTIHMNRQTSLVAGRRLRVVKDTLREWRTEWNVRDDGVRWIEQGCWDQRLKSRDCAEVCKEVMSGFEEVCDRWRERLLQSGAVGAPGGGGGGVATR